MGMTQPKGFAPPGELGMDGQPSRVVTPLPPPTTQPVAPMAPPTPMQQTIAATPTVASPNSTTTDPTSIAPRNMSTIARNKMNQYADYL